MQMANGKWQINRQKTVKERKQYGAIMIEEILKSLQSGFSPFENHNNYSATNNNEKTVVDALEYAYKQKVKDVKESTADGYKVRKDAFIDWLYSNHLLETPINQINKRHIAGFLNHIASKSSNRNVNNYKNGLSALFTKLVDDDILKYNIFLTIKNRKTTTTRHKTYSIDELTKIKTYLKEHDMSLYQFMSIVAYTFLRNREVLRLQVKNIDLANSRIFIGNTKTVKNDVVVIIDTVKPIFESLNLDQYKPNDYLFTPNGHPAKWTIKERDKVSYFGKRFRKVKKHLKLDVDNTIYSLRHNFAVDLFNYFLSQGLNEREAILKMLPITRHSNESSLRNYLRSVNAYIPEDFSDKFTLDF